MESKPGNLEGLAATSGKAIEKEGNIETKPKDPAPAPSTANVPDPDEDDLDDLDDMLDEFTPSKTEPSTTASAKPPLPQSKIPAVEDGLSDEDFAKQLQAGMADLLGELESSPEMASQFESMLKELGAAGGLDDIAGVEAGSSTEAKSTTTEKEKTAPAAGAAAGEESFQETIRKTMERMRASGDQATAAATTDSAQDDLLAEMMKAMQDSGLGDGEGSEEQFSKMLLGMMEQLTNKEILYEPMKELHDKFPDWMKNNEGKVDEADMKRYKEQQAFVKEIVERFEKKGYSDDNAADREYIVERMQKMQAAGSPPPDLVGDMEAAQEAFGAPEESCPQQ